MITEIKSFIDSLSDYAHLSPAVLSPLLKILGISIITKIGAEAGRDCDAKAVSASIEIAGAAAAVYVALPLISAALKLITSFI
jgi:stage III sporulation protein AD